MVGHPLDQFWVDLDGTEVGEAIWVQAHTVPPLALRRLPIRVEPRPGEAFAGWIERLAAEIGAPIGVVLDACGLGVNSSALGPRSPYGVALAPSHLANLAGALDLPPPDERPRWCPPIQANRL